VIQRFYETIVFDNDGDRNVVFMATLTWNAASISMKTGSATKGHCVYNRPLRVHYRPLCLH
jgi:hypothetical protein